MTRRTRLTFCGADADDDSLPRSVMDGRKTVTAETVEDYYKPYSEYGDGSYATGDIIDLQSEAAAALHHQGDQGLLDQVREYSGRSLARRNLFQRRAIPGVP